ncbi:hypothetical protein Q7689_13635, partial [Nocardiopsis tropica]|nr:hypothetical protein [Nocardiopsis tropica]
MTAQGTPAQVQGAPILDTTPNQAHSLWEYTDHLRGMVDEGLVTGDVGPEDRDDFAWIVSDIDTALRYAALPVAITVHLGADRALLRRLGIDPHDPGRVVGTVVDIPHYLSGTFGTRAAEDAPAYLMLRIPHGFPAAHIRPSSPGRVLVARGARLYIHAAYTQSGEPAPGTRVEDLLFVEAEVVPGHWAPPPGHHPSPSHDAHHGYRPSTVSTPPADPPLPDTFEGLLHGFEEGGVLNDDLPPFTGTDDDFDPMESDPIAFLDAPDVLGLLDTGDPFGFLNEDVDMLGGEESFPAGPADRPDPGPVADPPVFPSVRPSGGSGHETTAPIDAGTDQVTDRIKKLNDGQFEVLVALGAGRTDEQLITRGWKPRGLAKVMGGLTRSLGLRTGDRAGIVEVAVAAGLVNDTAPHDLLPGERQERALIRIRFLRPEQREILAHYANRLQPSDIAKRLSSIPSTVNNPTVYVGNVIDHLSHRLGVRGRGEAGDVARLAELEAPPLPVLTDEQKNQAIDRITTLDDREFDLLVALGAERNDKEILDRPGWKPRGLAIVMGRLPRSLGLQAGDRVGAAAVAVAAGLTNDTDPDTMTSDERQERAVIRIRFLRPEQREVLAHYANGLQPSDIAKRLSSIPDTVSNPTVYIHNLITHFSHRLGVLGRGEAGAAALAAELEAPPLPVLSEEQKNQAIARITTLSDREFEVLVALGAGRTDEQLITRGWKPRGLTNVMGGLTRSLGLQAGDRAGIAEVAVAAGLTDDKDPGAMTSDERHERALIRIRFLRPEQHEVLAHYANGLKASDIAKRISPNANASSVDGLLTNLSHRLGVSGRGEAMKAAQTTPALAAEVAALRPAPVRAVPTRVVRPRVAPAPELTPEQIAWAVDRINDLLKDSTFQVFVHMGAGLDDIEEIGTRVGLRPHTVTNYISQIVRDLKLNSSKDIVAVAAAAGLAPTTPHPPPPS